MENPLQNPLPENLIKWSDIARAGAEIVVDKSVSVAKRVGQLLVNHLLYEQGDGTRT